VEPQRDEIEDAAKFPRRNEQILGHTAEHRRTDVVEREDESLVSAYEAPRGPTARKWPQRRAEKGFQMWAKGHSE
jgi:hypothetical protein